MKVETTIMLMPHQPSEAAMNLMHNFAADWNRNHVHVFSDQMGLLLDLRFPDNAHPEYREILKALEKFQTDTQVQVHVAHHRVYDANDYATADFIEINGAALDEKPGLQLVVNASKVLTPAPCPQCGYLDAFDCEQTGPFTIGEAELDRLPAEGTPPPPGGWDFVDVEAGHKLISSRFSQLLALHHVEGYTLEPVLSDAVGTPSKRVWQLRARRAVVCPCPEHTPAINGDFCPTCGAAHCDVEAEDWVRDDSLEGDEIFSRHRNHGAILYVSGRLYRLLVAAGIQQIKPARIFRKCHHG